jgi:hypothetical protein
MQPQWFRSLLDVLPWLCRAWFCLAESNYWHLVLGGIMNEPTKLQRIAVLLLSLEAQEKDARENSGWDINDPEWSYWEGVSDVRNQIAQIITGNHDI